MYGCAWCLNGAQNMGLINGQKMSSVASAKLANMGIVCAFMVVGIHIGTFPMDGVGDYIFGMIGGNGILRMAVPFFFFASGFFCANSYLNGRSYGYQLKSRCKSLLVPYILWNIIYMLFECCVSRQFPQMSIISIINIFGLNLIDRPIFGFLWFLRLLMILIIASPIFYWATRLPFAAKLLPIGFVVSGALFCPSSYYERWFLIAEYAFCFEGVFLFYAGMCLRIRPIDMNIRLGKTFWLILGVGLWVARVLMVKLQFPLAAYWFSWFGIVVSIYALYLTVPDKPFPKFIIAEAFPLYLVHPFVVAILAGLIKASGHREYILTSVTLFVVRWVLVILVSFVAIKIGRKIMPRLTGVLFGGR